MNASVTPSTPKAMYWTGWVLSVLPCLMLIMSAYMKFKPNAEALEQMTKTGFPMQLAVPLGITELACVVLYLFQGLGLSASAVETLLYKKSGLLGISGISNDMRILLDNPAPAAQLAVQYFVYRVAKEIGALTAVLDGLDAIVFTAGIGENSAEIRRRICQACAWLGVEVDGEANARKDPRISTTRSRVSAWVIPTNEELMIARHTGRLLGLVASAA